MISAAKGITIFIKQMEDNPRGNWAVFVDEEGMRCAAKAKKKKWEQGKWGNILTRNCKIAKNNPQVAEYSYST